MGGSKGGFSPFCKRKGHQNCCFRVPFAMLACLGKLHRLHDGDFGKNTLLEKYKIDNHRESNFKFFRGVAKVGKSFDEIMSYKQTPVLSL